MSPNRITAAKSLRIWIDLANSPHVPFFRALIPEFVTRGHQIEISARDFAQTVELAKQAGLLPHDDWKSWRRKTRWQSRKPDWPSGRACPMGSRSWIRSRSQSQFVLTNMAAAALGIRSVTLMDYEHQPANHLAFRFASNSDRAARISRQLAPEEIRRVAAQGRALRRVEGR